MKKEINAAGAPGAIGPYSQAIEAGGFLYVSGQLPINAADGTMPADIKGQTTQSLENVKAILAEAGAYRQRSQDNRFPCRHEPVRPHERGLRHILLKAFPRTLRLRREGTPQAGISGNRGHSKTLKSRGYFKINGLKLILRTTKVMGRTPAP